MAQKQLEELKQQVKHYQSLYEEETEMSQTLQADLDLEKERADAAEIERDDLFDQKDKIENELENLKRKHKQLNSNRKRKGKVDHKALDEKTHTIEKLEKQVKTLRLANRETVEKERASHRVEQELLTEQYRKQITQLQQALIDSGKHPEIIVDNDNYAKLTREYNTLVEEHSKLNGIVENLQAQLNDVEKKENETNRGVQAELVRLKKENLTLRHSPRNNNAHFPHFEEEIEALRTRIKTDATEKGSLMASLHQKDEQISQLQTHISSLEEKAQENSQNSSPQSPQLEEEIIQSNEKIKALMSQNSTLQASLDQKDKQISQLKTQVSSLESVHENSQSSSTKSSQLEEEIVQSNEKMRVLISQNSTLQASLGAKDTQVSQLETHISKLETQISKLETDLSSAMKLQRQGSQSSIAQSSHYESEIAELSEKIKMETSQNSILQNSVKSKDEQISKLHSQITSLETQLKEESERSRDMQNQKLTIFKEKIHKLTDEYEKKLKAAKSQHEIQLEAEKSLYSSKQQEHLSEISELATLQEQLQSYKSEEITLQQKLRTRDAEYAKLEDDFHALKMAQITTDEQNQRAKSEISKLEKKVASYESEIGDMENKLTVTQTERTRKLSELTEAHADLESRKSKVSELQIELESANSRYAFMSEKHSKMSRELSAKILRTTELESQITQLQRENITSASEAQQSAHEVGRLKCDLEHQKALMADVEEQVRGYQESNNRLQNIVDEQKVMIDDLNSQNQANADETERLATALSEKEFKTSQQNSKEMERLCTALNEKEKLLVAKENLLAEVQEQLSSSEASQKVRLNEYEEKLYNLESEKQQVSEERANLKSEIDALNTKVTTLDTEVIHLNTQKQNDGVEIVTLKSELEAARKEIEASQSELKSNQAEAEERAKESSTELDKYKTLFEEEKRLREQFQERAEENERKTPVFDSDSIPQKTNKKTVVIDTVSKPNNRTNTKTSNKQQEAVRVGGMRSNSKKFHLTGDDEDLPALESPPEMKVDIPRNKPRNDVSFSPSVSSPATQKKKSTVSKITRKIFGRKKSSASRSSKNKRTVSDVLKEMLVADPEFGMKLEELEFREIKTGSYYFGTRKINMLLNSHGQLAVKTGAGGSQLFREYVKKQGPKELRLLRRQSQSLSLSSRVASPPRKRSAFR